LRFGDNGDGKRGDVRVCTHEDLLNVDIVGLHPASKTHRSTAYMQPGAAAREGEEIKTRDQGSGATGHTLVPFAIETYGRPGRSALEWLKVWA